MKFQVVITPAEDGGFSVSVPALEDCYTHGKTKEEALGNAKKAILRYLEGVEKINKILFKGDFELEEVKITLK